MLKAVLVLIVATAACGGSAAEAGPTGVTFDGEACASSLPASTSGPLSIAIDNESASRMAVVMGTYADGYDHADLVAYGYDVTVRPDFALELEIYEVGPETTRDVTFDHGPGRYFAVCMDSPDSMFVLDDVVVDG